VTRLLDDPALGARLGQAALETVRSRYTLDIIAGAYLDLFRELS
jgi:glycosyltransferase involved in cell wall biosynthesis